MLLRKNIPIKYILANAKYELLFIALYATIIGLLDARMHFGISFSAGVPMILGTIISLLLAFRSNQAYDRWWEARIIWGSIVNDSRTLARLIAYLPKEAIAYGELSSFKERFIKRQIAWCYSLGCSLRNQESVGKIVDYLSPEELQHTFEYSNVPNSLLMLHSKELSRAYEAGYINAYQQMEIEHMISNLCDSMGKCERIKNTVFPTTYSLYIQFALWIFILLFPFALTSDFGLFEIPIMVGITSTLLLIEKMATHLQDPFENKESDTPITAITKTIERDLRQMLQEKDFHSETVGESYYIL